MILLKFFFTYLFTHYYVTGTTIKIEKPEIGVYQMNFKYEIVKVISDVPNSQVTLPLLKPNYYTETTYQLICRAAYPIQWVYSGFEYPQAHVTTSRLTSNDLDDEEFLKIFEARVIFSFTETNQAGNYSCEGLSNPELHTYVDIIIAGDSGNTDYSVGELPAQQNNESPTKVEDLRIFQRGDNTIVCCSKSNQFPKLTFQNCESISDCGLKLNYMENKPKCKARSCNVGTLRIKQMVEGGQKCSTYENFDENGGIVQCSALKAENKYLIFTTSEADHKLITNFNSIPPTKDILKLFVEPTSSGDIFISCVPNWFFFSRGIKWAVQNEYEKTFKLLNDDTNNLRVNKNDFTGRKVICFAPLWNSADWRNVSTTVA